MHKKFVRINDTLEVQRWITISWILKIQRHLRCRGIFSFLKPNRIVIRNGHWDLLTDTCNSASSLTLGHEVNWIRNSPCLWQPYMNFTIFWKLTLQKFLFSCYRSWIEVCYANSVRMYILEHMDTQTLLWTAMSHLINLRWNGLEHHIWTVPFGDVNGLALSCLWGHCKSF